MISLFCKYFRGQRSIRILALACSAALGLAGQPRPVQAEPYLRVCKHGVVYYYFSNQWSDSAPTFHPLAKIPVTPPSARKRLSSRELEPLIQEASRRHHLPPSLVKAVIRAESNFNPTATSPKGAQGLMQLMPRTADDLKVTDPYDPRENVWGGVRYLRMLLEKFNFQLPLALAAYNAGPQRVSEHHEVPAIPETQGFVQDVCANFLKYSKESSTPPVVPGTGPPPSRQ